MHVMLDHVPHAVQVHTRREYIDALPGTSVEARQHVDCELRLTTPAGACDKDSGRCRWQDISAYARLICFSLVVPGHLHAERVVGQNHEPLLYIAHELPRSSS